MTTTMGINMDETTRDRLKSLSTVKQRSERALVEAGSDPRISRQMRKKLKTVIKKPIPHGRNTSAPENL